MALEPHLSMDIRGVSGGDSCSAWVLRVIDCWYTLFKHLHHARAKQREAFRLPRNTVAGITSHKAEAHAHTAAQGGAPAAAGAVSKHAVGGAAYGGSEKCEDWG